MLEQENIVCEAIQDTKNELWDILDYIRIWYSQKVIVIASVN